MIDMGYRVADNNAISGTASCGGKAVKVSYSQHKKLNKCILEIEQETCKEACGVRAICKVTTNGEAECSCPDGSSGDPTVSCSKNQNLKKSSGKTLFN